jgi:DNA helicase II / ATP-dependent DNA helicase PcrA
MMSGLDSLNERQLQAVRHGDEPLLVLAGAGTGKTATLAHRVAALIERDARPGRILLLTFTRRAAEEMIRRVESLLGGSPGRAPLAAPVWGGTFHSVAARLLRLHGAALGLPANFTIMDRADAEDLLNLLRADLEPATRQQRFPLKGTCLDIYSRTVNAQEPLEEVLESRFTWCRAHRQELAQLFRSYLARKQAKDLLDYDDLLLFWHGLMRHASASAFVRGRFDHVLVDEYQDTNRLQADILELLCPGGRGLTVVGDDAQSIYSFRAATVRNILEFPQRFPEARRVTLEESYRAHPPLLAAANAVLAESQECFVKRLRSSRPAGPRPALVNCSDEGEQAELVVRRVLDLREQGTPLQRQAVLFRAAHHSLVLELELTRRNIPFRKFGGLKFLEAAHVKDFLAFLRVAENPRDEPAALRMLLLLPGIGPQRARALVDEADRAGSLEPWRRFRPPSAAAEIWPQLLTLLDRLRASPGDLSLSGQLALVRDVYQPLLERVHDHPTARLSDIESLVALGGRYPDKASLLAELVLDPPSFTGELAGPPLLDDDYLVLSTIHSAKGLEWQAVYLIHAADGNLPSDLACGSDEEIEEERRLFYVALTRAREHLEVYVPLCYFTQPRSPFDRFGWAQPSRFLTPAVRGCFEEVESTGSFGAQGDGTLGDSDLPGHAGGQISAADVRASLESLW